MARDEDDDDSLPPIGEGTEGFLEDAKKGKPRFFLLICKGAKVKYLKVKKKQVKKGEITEAKKLGYKGDSYIGVLTGKGMELVFNLAIADGYDSEPVKDKILKDFLEEHAGFKCKPSFAIVATAPDIPFDEEDLNHPLIARFLALVDRVAQVLDQNAGAAAELKPTTTEIRGMLQDGEFAIAEPRIDSLEKRIQELLSGEPAATQPPQTAPSSTSPPPTTSPVVDNDALKQKLQEALNKLVPQLKQAVVTYPDKKVELLTPVAQIKKQMDAGELQEAKKGILAVGQLLKTLMQSSAPGGSTGGNTNPVQPQNAELAEYEQKLATLQPNYDLALRDMLGDTNKFRTVMTYIKEQAEAQVFGNAIKALDRLSIAIQQAISKGAESQPSSGSVSIAKLGKARLEWRQVKSDAMGGIKRFIEKLTEEFGNDQEQQSQLQQAIDKLESIMLDFDDSLTDALDGVLNAAGTDQQRAVAEVAIAKMNDFVRKIDSDEIMRSIDGNSLMPDLLVCAPMRSKLDEIAAAFG